MQNKVELHQFIYHFLESQIKFGNYRFGDSLPTIKETSKYFCVSYDTVRLSYVKLKQEGLISLNTCIGAKVQVQYSDEEIQNYIGSYFSCRKDALLDLAKSTRPLCGFALWLSLKNSSSELLDEIEQSCIKKEMPPSFIMLKNLLPLYGSLGNDLFTWLCWQMFMFCQAPVLSISKNISYFIDFPNPLLHMIDLCRKNEWRLLRDIIDDYQKQFYTNICQFYQTDFPLKSEENQLTFSWNIYKKTSQICYSLGMEILRDVRCGVYQVGDFLPSPVKLAKEKGVSVNTIRRTLILLNKIGAAQSINGVGTRLMPSNTSSERSDFTDPVIRERLLDFVKSLQAMALSCKASAYLTITSMDDSEIQQWIGQFDAVKQGGRYEMLLYICIEHISLFSPYQTIRTVYGELLQQLFWGYPLYNLHGSQEEINAFNITYLESLRNNLLHCDAYSFSEKLEELLIAEARMTANRLIEIGIQEASLVIIPIPEY